MKRLLWLVPFMALGGCVTTNQAASIRGACDALDPPSFVVLGKRRVDQHQIDRWVEQMVSACGFSRPKAQEMARKVMS